MTKLILPKTSLGMPRKAINYKFLRFRIGASGSVQGPGAWFGTWGLGLGTRATFFTVGLLVLAQGGSPPVEPGVVPETMATSWSRTRARCWGGIWTLKANAFRKKMVKAPRPGRRRTCSLRTRTGAGWGDFQRPWRRSPGRGCSDGGAAEGLPSVLSQRFRIYRTQSSGSASKPFGAIAKDCWLRGPTPSG